MFKFENVANVGDRIRAHDFHERPDCYVEGIVTAKDTEGNNGFACFVITVDVDGWPKRKNDHFPILEGAELVQVDENTIVIRNVKGGRVGRTTYVPMEVSFMEWDGRILKV